MPFRWPFKLSSGRLRRPCKNLTQKAAGTAKHGRNTEGPKYLKRKNRSDGWRGSAELE